MPSLTSSIVLMAAIVVVQFACLVVQVRRGKIQLTPRTMMWGTVLGLVLLFGGTVFFSAFNPP